MTREQEQAANKAYIDMLWNDFLKKVAYENHCTAAEWVTLYGLPYRVALDYLKHPEAYKGKCRINPCYPLAGFPREELLTISLDDLDKERCTHENADGTQVLDMDFFKTPRPEVQERITEHNKQFLPIWHNDTAAGLQEWERVFAYYLIPYDFDTFTVFDMYGKADGNEADLNERKAYYKGVQERYKAGTDYMTEPPPYKPEYDNKYTTHEFILEWENEPKEDI